MKTILTIFTLFFFISSGLTSYISIPSVCDQESCCISECCEVSVNNGFIDDVSISSENNCCNFEKGIPGKVENSVLANIQSGNQTFLIFNHTISFSHTHSGLIHTGIFTTKPPLVHNFSSPLRI